MICLIAYSTCLSSQTFPAGQYGAQTFRLDVTGHCQPKTKVLLVKVQYKGIKDGYETLEYWGRTCLLALTLLYFQILLLESKLWSADMINISTPIFSSRLSLAILQNRNLINSYKNELG